MNRDEEAIRAVVAAWMDASARGDVDAVLALMSPEAVFLVGGQPAMHGSAAFATSLRALLATHRIDAGGRIEEIEIAGDMAYCRSQLSVSAVPLDGGPARRMEGPTLTIFRRGSNGCWLLTRDANMLTPLP